MRDMGTESAPIYAADLALAVDLTGRKSWRRLVPQLRAGLGVVSSRAQDDSSGFSFGTPFAFTFGGGLKFVPGGRLQLRMDVTDRVFKLSYPDPYYRKASDNTTVLLLNMGAATSGVTKRMWGPGLHHLIDPRTARPARTDLQEVSVLAKTATDAEIFAKVALLLGREAAPAWLEGRSAGWSLA